uniref:(northern house mosquito) hypothetical protein n=1 Tax=Culex pipiens TaxID=7175 RepID=A0A8D8L8I9_CULPI
MDSPSEDRLRGGNRPNPDGPGHAKIPRCSHDQTAAAQADRRFDRVLSANPAQQLSGVLASVRTPAQAAGPCQVWLSGGVEAVLLPEHVGPLEGGGNVAVVFPLLPRQRCSVRV